MGNCGTKAKPQLTSPEIEIGRMLHAVHKGFDQKYSADLVADGIDTPELLQAASSQQLLKAGVSRADAMLITTQVKIAPLRIAQAGSIGESDTDFAPGEFNEGDVGAISRVHVFMSHIVT